VATFLRLSATEFNVTGRHYKHSMHSPSHRGSASKLHPFADQFSGPPEAPLFSFDATVSVSTNSPAVSVRTVFELDPPTIADFGPPSLGDLFSPEPLNLGNVNFDPFGMSAALLGASGSASSAVSTSSGAEYSLFGFSRSEVRECAAT